jgi:hypothetical protein
MNSESEAGILVQLRKPERNSAKYEVLCVARHYAKSEGIQEMLMTRKVR